MKKLTSYLIAVLLFLSIFSGCSRKDLDVAKNTTEDYLKALYTVKDYTKILDTSTLLQLSLKASEDVKPYVTEEMHKRLMTDRVFICPPTLALKHKGNIEVGKITFNKSSINKEKNTITLNIIATINLKAKDGNIIKSLNKSCVIQLKKVNGSYKVNGHNDILFDFK